jgi:hypothetical protein
MGISSGRLAVYVNKSAIVINTLVVVVVPARGGSTANTKYNIDGPCGATDSQQCHIHVRIMGVKTK